MKKLSLVLAVVLFSAASAFSQIERPVKWSYLAKKINKTEAVLYIKANIEEGWHIYSQNVKPGGPIKTTFTFSPSKDYALNGKTTEPKPINYYDQNFKMNVNYFGDGVVFKQKFKLNKDATTVKGKVEFMVCNDKQCLPPDEVSFSIPVGK